MSSQRHAPTSLSKPHILRAESLTARQGTGKQAERNRRVKSITWTVLSVCFHFLGEPHEVPHLPCRILKDTPPPDTKAEPSYNTARLREYWGKKHRSTRTPNYHTETIHHYHNENITPGINHHTILSSAAALSTDIDRRRPCGIKQMSVALS